MEKIIWLKVIVALIFVLTIIIVIYSLIRGRLASSQLESMAFAEGNTI